MAQKRRERKDSRTKYGKKKQRIRTEKKTRNQIRKERYERFSKAKGPSWY